VTYLETYAPSATISNRERRPRGADASARRRRTRMSSEAVMSAYIHDVASAARAYGSAPPPARSGLRPRSPRARGR
jgi:hypothetical protein